MESHSEKGKDARNYFIQVEDRLKTTHQAKTAMEILELQFAALKEVDGKVESINKDLQEFKRDLPILGIEESKITAAVRKTGVMCLGGKDSNAYRDKSLRGQVYSDIYREIKRQFGLASYKAIKRSQCDLAIKTIECYRLPFTLKEQITDTNAQVTFKTVV